MDKSVKLYLLISLICCIYFFYSIASILAPFIVGIIVAYLLDPLVTYLESYTSRSLAAISSLLFLIVSVSFALFIIGPYLYRELVSLVIDMPGYLKNIHAFLKPHIEYLHTKFGIEDYNQNGDVWQRISRYIVKISSAMLGNIWSSGIALINIVALAIITPIISFYILRDWHNITKGFFSFVPRKNLKSVQKICLEIDQVLSGYIRGQLNVCLLLGLFYAIGLTLVNLNHGLLLGFTSGILTIVPYFGIVIGLIAGVVIGLLQGFDYMQVSLVVLVYLLGQFIEGNFVTPKLVGDKVGLHPAIIIFALLSGASLFGFIGILFAIPVTASLWVLLSHFLVLYKKSSSYK